VDIARLAPFAAFIDTAMLIEGEAHAKLQGRGTLGEPDITGRVTAQKLGVALPAEGVTLTGGSLVAVLTQREIRLESFSIRGGDGVLTAQGTLARTGFDRASLDWRAERFTALARPDRRLVVTGNGNAALEAGKLSLTGKLRANEGEFEIGGSSLPKLGDDVVIVGRERRVPEAEARKLQRVAIDVYIDLGNQVQVSGEGLSVRLSGDMRVYTNAQGEMRGSGTVNARNGTFVAYGQRLEIERGRFFFNGPLTNPALDVVAMRKRQAVEAGVAVTGTLRNPVVRVVSNPPLPEGEALSWLLLGRAPGDAGTGELSALPLATGALLGRATAPIKSALKLDELGFRGAGAGDQFLTLGKRISDRLYVVFEQGLGAAESLLRLEYTLTRRIVLRLQAGEPTSVGVFYRRAWD
jgi:translocation and assembly module TamB